MSPLAACLLTAVAAASTAVAATDAPAPSPARSSALAWLLEQGAARAPELRAASADVHAQEAALASARRATLIPAVDATAGNQWHTYSHLTDRGGPTPVVNDGTNPFYGVTVSYDLQRLLGPDRWVALGAARYAELQHEVARRALARSIKRSYYSALELSHEVAALRDLIDLFGRIDAILERQRAAGVYNQLERGQFAALKGILEADLAARQIDHESAVSALASAALVSEEEVRARLAVDETAPVLHYAGAPAPPPALADSTAGGPVFESLGRDLDLARRALERYHAAPLPGVYVKALHENPSMPSADGPQLGVEAGVTFPLSSGLSRAAERARLQAQLERAGALYDRGVADYRAALRLDLVSLARLQAQRAGLDESEKRADELLESSFKYFAQKRLDALGTIDLFQKHLDTERRVLQNELQARLIDADLGYLLGGPAR